MLLQQGRGHPATLDQAAVKLAVVNMCIAAGRAASGKYSDFNVMLLAQRERHVGAIASALAGEIYGLDTVQDSITDKLTNTTRFLVMSREHTVPKEITAPAMTTIIFEVRSVPAVLYKALGGFATNGINLTKLESYMLDGSMNAARFYVDCEGHPETASMKLALEELQFYCTDGGIRILGTYPTNR